MNYNFQLFRKDNNWKQNYATGYSQSLDRLSFFIKCNHSSHKLTDKNMYSISAENLSNSLKNLDLTVAMAAGFKF